MEHVRQVFEDGFESGRRLHAFESFPGTKLAGTKLAGTKFTMAWLRPGIVGPEKRKSVT